MFNSVRNRCRFGRLMIGKYSTWEEVEKNTGCSVFFYVKKSKENQLFCDRFCQQKYRAYIKGEEKLST